MIEEHFRKKFYDKIKFGAKIAIYDAGIVARRIYEDIKTKRPDVEVKYFIDKNQTGTSIKKCSPLRHRRYGEL